MAGVRILVGTIKGAFVLTSDEARQDWQVSGPHFLGWETYHVQGSPLNPDRVWAAPSMGWFGQQIHRSDDGGESWREVSGDLPTDFGFPIAVHPHESETVYVVPITSDSHHVVPDGRLRVYRTRSGGGEWEPLTAGLPQEHCYVNVLRDCRAVDRLESAGVGREVTVTTPAPVTIAGVLDVLEERHPVLRGTIRGHGGGPRRPFVRFFA